MFLNFANRTIILYMQLLLTFLLNLFLRKITSLPDYNKKKYILIITLQLRVVFFHFDIKKSRCYSCLVAVSLALAPTRQPNLSGFDSHLHLDIICLSSVCLPRIRYLFRKPNSTEPSKLKFSMQPELIL